MQKILTKMEKLQKTLLKKVKYYLQTKKATRLLSFMGFTRPMSPKHSGYMGNIYRNSRDVKIEGVPFSDAFEEKNSGPFALRAPAEETKDLIAVHNATEKNIRGMLGLGGLPMPSIAIIKAAQGHDDFGEYSFVFDKSTIDPTTNKNNKVYGSDAFTPVAPHIEYEVKDDKAYKEFQSEISNLNKKMPATNHTLMNIHNYNYFNMLLTSAGGLEGLKENLFNDEEMRNAFLYTEGEYVPRVIEKVEVKSKKQAFINI